MGMTNLEKHFVSVVNQCNICKARNGICKSCITREDAIKWLLAEESEVENEAGKEEKER